MLNWRTTRTVRVLTRRHQNIQLRRFSSQKHVETVAVRCASSGSIDVNLYNVSQHKPTHPLVIYLPPFSQTGHNSIPPLPGFLSSYPAAVINYRWLSPTGHPAGSESQSSPFRWPTPMTDTLFGYSWIVDNLAPPDGEKRDIYVYGSYLGAGIATSLALTESHLDRDVAVRGLLTYNGIYNWTMFLPDHPIHQRKTPSDSVEDTSYVEGSFFHYLHDKLGELFHSPEDMFDGFISPWQFFRYPGLHVPNDFTTPLAPSIAKGIDALSAGSAAPQDDVGSASGATSSSWHLEPPSKSYITYPPWPFSKTLKIPETLLLHESPPPRTSAAWTKGQKTASQSAKKRKVLNNFEGQATGLLNLMRRSVEKDEFKGREDTEGASAEAERRLQIRDVGPVEGDGTLGASGQEVAAAWLKERIGS